MFDKNFIAEREQSYLKKLTDIGPRVGGSFENEFMATDLILEIAHNLSTYANPVHKIEIDHQIASGNFSLDRKDYPFTCVFKKIQNVVVKLTAAIEEEPRNYLLLNAHFDSVPTSPGAGDDGAMVAAMLEILTKLTKSNETYKHGLIFLFNGFEENNKQGSYAFVTQHQWFKNVR